MTETPLQARKGRGAVGNPAGRFERERALLEDDGWGSLEDWADEPSPRTTVMPDTSRSVITRNDSPDLGFDLSCNPYRGCEHGCVYCYARPSHGFLGLSSGLDFETKLFAKHDAPAQFRKELAAPSYVCDLIVVGVNTDCYQPIERGLRLTRGLLEVALEARQPLGIVTKSALILRDLDILRPMAELGLVKVSVSVTTLDATIARTLEPRAAAPHRRLATIKALAEAGVPTGVNVAPIIPGLTDHEIEPIVNAAAEHGARRASYTLLRLPYEIKDLFSDWLDAHVPDRAARVLALVRETRGGKLYRSSFDQRMHGKGVYADMIRQRMILARRRFGMALQTIPLRTDLFRRPSLDRRQLELL
ncbi:PA0069 family radical SAM protein [Marinivivus vitaminiproducens]|uniref:PA0069 family radical SAM protein n=1 Tax=Marinivivus vitaminiproducens TaxID=3035935 RepID=UPI00279B5A3B|nr:PA0069 family radical SAM protein [Geminicoccaceae bacterium SCSIO 64248]